MSRLEDHIGEHLEKIDGERLWMSRKAFYENGLAMIGYVLPESVKQSVADAVQRLLDAGSVRRDLQLAETGNTPRRMRNVTAEQIRADQGVVSALYSSPVFTRALSSIAGEEVIECPYEPEQYVITHLERPGDTHGWHWDDYSFGVIVVIDCPPLHLGGFVQTVPNTRWNKDDPQVYRQLVENPTLSYELHSGDIYLLRTDTTMHRVHPIEKGASRTIINMAYAARRDLSAQISHETMEDLFRV